MEAVKVCVAPELELQDAQPNFPTLDKDKVCLYVHMCGYVQGYVCGRVCVWGGMWYVGRAGVVHYDSIHSCIFFFWKVIHSFDSLAYLYKLTKSSQVFTVEWNISL